MKITLENQKVIFEGSNEELTQVKAFATKEFTKSMLNALLEAKFRNTLNSCEAKVKEISKEINELYETIKNV